jgi:signal transduction histidine kinase
MKKRRVKAIRGAQRFLALHFFRRFGSRRRGRLVRHYFLISVLLISGGLTASGLLEVYFRYRESREQLDLFNQEVAAGAAFKIARFVQEIETLMRAATKSRDIILKGLSQEYRFELRRLFLVAPAITDAVVIDTAGVIRARASRLRTVFSKLDVDLVASPAFLQGRQGRSYFGPVYLVRGSEPHMTIAVPIEPFAGNVIGVLVAQVNLKYINEVVSDIKVGKAGYAYAVTRSGDLIAHPDVSLVLRARNVAQLSHVKAVFQSSAKAAKPSATVTHNFQGLKVLSSYALIPGLNWAVFIELPVQEAYAQIYASIFRTSTLLLLGLGMALLASLFVARRVVHPLETLRKGVERIAGGDMGLRLDLKTGDEIEILAEEFNKMAQNLRQAYAGLEHKVAERTQELAVANDRLKELDRLKSDFVSNVSHELRTPLTAIKGAVDLVLREVPGPLNEKQTHYLTRVRSNTQHLAGLINDLLDLSKIEEGKIELQTNRVSIGGLVHEVVETLRPIAAEKPIVLEMIAPEPSILVWADRDKVTQVLMNLIGNAIKFSPPQGRVMVSTIKNGREWVRVSVNDSGPGISSEEKEKVFEKFYQVAESGMPKPKGTGLGLAISKALVELHGGKIWVDSEPNRGSTFCFTLPASASGKPQSLANTDVKVG